MGLSVAQQNFFQEKQAIAKNNLGVLPKIDKVESFDTWLNNAAAVFKFINSYSVKIMSDIILENDSDPYFPPISFCIDFVAKVTFQFGEAFENLSNFLFPNEEKDQEMISFAD